MHVCVCVCLCVCVRLIDSGRFDKDGNGVIDLAELSEVLLQNNPSRDVLEALTAAIITVLRFDDNMDATIDRNEFKKLVTSLAEEMGETVRRTAAILVLAPFSLKMSEYVDKYGHSSSAHAALNVVDEKHDARMRELFVLFDEDLDGSIDFGELVAGLMKLKLTLPKAKTAAVHALLLCDAGSERKLTYEQFAEFIINFCIIAGYLFPEVADALVFCAAGNDPEPSVKTALQAFEESDVITTALDKRLHVIFKSFDSDGDDKIDFAELLRLMRSFEPTVSRSQVEADAVEGFAEFDAEKDGFMDRVEFAEWLTSFCKKTTANMDEVLEFLLTAAALGKHAESVYPSSSDRWWAGTPPSKRRHLEAVTEEEEEQ